MTLGVKKEETFPTGHAVDAINRSAATISGPGGTIAVPCGLTRSYKDDADRAVRPAPGIIDAFSRLDVKYIDTDRKETANDQNTISFASRPILR